jgi:hypothetical protein
MPTDDHSFRKVLPGFVISTGTQAVLKVAKAPPDGAQLKPPGSVGPEDRDRRPINQFLVELRLGEREFNIGAAWGINDPRI